MGQSDPVGLEILRMAFARHVLQELWGNRAPSEPEQLLLEALAPRERLRAAGLLDEHDQFTALWIDARAQALERLPRELSHEDKLRLLRDLFEVSVADGQLERQEGSGLLGAATLLGVGSSEFDALLDTLTEHVGSIELGLPEVPET